MNLIDEMVIYCAENGFIDKSHALKLYQIGLIESLPRVFVTDDDNCEPDYCSGRPYNRCDDIEDDLDMTEEVLARCNAKPKSRAKGGGRSKRRSNQEKLTAVQLNDRLKETFDQIFADRELIRTVTIPARCARIPVPPRSELTEKALFDALVALNSLSDGDLDKLLRSEFNTLSPRHLMFNDVYRGWLFPFAGDFSRCSGPAVRAFRQFFCSGYQPDLSGKYAWILKQFRVNCLFQLMKWERRLFESVRYNYLNNQSQFFSWSDPYYIAGNPDWNKIRKKDILSCFVAAMLSPLENSDEDEQSLSAKPWLRDINQVILSLVNSKKTELELSEFICEDQKDEQLRVMAVILAMALDADTFFEKMEQLCKSGQGERRIVTISDVEYAFRWCPPGTFMMGSPEDEKERSENESQHKVTLTRCFWLLETPVTQLMWKSVMGENPSHYKGDNLPVERVSWEDSQAFIGKLNGLFKSSQRIRLPSEAEWEYACRAGTTTPFNFGGVLNGDKANCDGNDPYGTNKKGPYLGKTTAVKSYSPNAWGLYDMHGNVWEWCEDWYDDYPSGSETDPTGPDSGSARVNRGGSWVDYALNCRSASRTGSVPATRRFNLGFRLALSSTH